MYDDAAVVLEVFMEVKDHFMATQDVLNKFGGLLHMYQDVLRT